MTTTLVLVTVFVAVFSAAILVILAFAKPRGHSRLQDRLKRTSNQQTTEERRLYKTVPLQVLEERLKPFAIERLTAQREAALQRQLIMAGEYATTPAQFVTRQLASALFLPVAFLLINWGAIGLALPVVIAGTLASAFIGYRLPASRLGYRIEQRQQVILRHLPTILDLLVTCVEAGMSLQSAMQKVVERTAPHPLREELERTLKEIQLGRPRGEALRHLGKRVGLKELNSVTIALVQAEIMGSAVAKTLRIQSEIIREARWQRAQEAAQKAPLKLVFPIVFL
ncbi:MAG: type II secretion system F family protein, partial [Cyanobacteria bacterium NC_groundwater_1444_Ag_S-0.65um_54_12]|nr:type II secretion system F family protein [Cyanobacteria bacterium NC_groundwater_1444_Ag_S-0.65um_54_12]